MTFYEICWDGTYSSECCKECLAYGTGRCHWDEQKKKMMIRHDEEESDD